MPNLVKLNLSYNDIGEEGVEAIADNLKYVKKLFKLYLDHNRINDNCVVMFSDAIKYVNDLAYLYLGYNLITDYGIIYLFNKMVKSRNIFIHVNVNNNFFQDDGFMAIVKAINVLDSCIRVDTSGNKIKDRERFIKYINSVPRRRVLPMKLDCSNIMI